MPLTDESTALSPRQDFEAHLEADRFSLRLFLTHQGARISSASGFIPKALHELIQSQKNSVSFEKDLAEYLERSEPALPLHLRTESGEVRLYWDASPCIAKTELNLSQGRVCVQRFLADKKSPDKPIRSFVRIGEGLAADLEGGRLMSLVDASGWYLADLLQEAHGETLSSAAPFEISSGLFNEKRVSYLAEQRGNYLKDLLLKADGDLATAAEGELSFRVTMERLEGVPEMALKGACFWDGQWFGLSVNFFKYFEHLHSMRAGSLRKKPVKRHLAGAALRLLSERSELHAEKAIELELAQLSLDKTSRWEAGEYLRRFFRLFVLHKTESLLVKRGGWYFVEADLRKFGLLFSELQRSFGGELLDWLVQQEKNVPVSELFENLRRLHARLESERIQLCYRERPVKKARFRVSVGARKARTDWFEMRPEVGWDGRTLSPDEWRAIVENRGMVEESGELWMLEEPSLRTLETLRELLHGGRTPKENSGPVRIPRLHVLDWLQLRRMGAELRLSPEEERFMRRLLRFEKLESVLLPQAFRGTLRDYQKEGYDWLAFLYRHGLGGCLADDMGLGKTVQAIAFLGGLREGRIVRPKQVVRTHLVVVPPTLAFNWKREFENFYPELDVREYGVVRGAALEGAEVILVTYESLRRDQKYFQRRRFGVVVFDEAQYMKNLSAKRTASARRLRCDFALTLTGTPLENHLGEYYSILDLSVPGLLGSYQDFRKRSLTDPLERLKKRAAPFVLRRTKDKTLKELPPKTETEVYLRMSTKQNALYRTVVAHLRRDVRKAFDQRPASQASLSALTAILRLRQICASPKILDRRVQERSPKIQFILSKLREVVEENHSALVFSQFTSFLDVLEEEIKAEKLDYYRMDGSTPKAKRKDLVDAFQCGAGAPIFLISLKTGGVGLNLTQASYVFHLDPWWNPAVEDQASDRVHRIGQKKNVFVTRLLMQHSIEEKIMTLKRKKSDLYRRVLEGSGPGTGKQGTLTKEDFEFLLGT